ncbi:MAG TPA: hypothetical protein DCQ30_01010 [Acidimicrobiaceae bacterium]|nr:hypothetical protein [Acidimicrobiaceae bacterium]
MIDPVRLDDAGAATALGGADVVDLAETLGTSAVFEAAELLAFGDSARPAKDPVAALPAPPGAPARAAGTVSDAVALASALVAASLLATPASGIPGPGRAGATLLRLAVCLPVLYAVLGGSRLQLRRRLGSTFAQELRDVALPLAAGTLVCIAGWQVVGGLTSLSPPSENSLLATCVLAAGSVALARRLGATTARRGRRRVVVVGSGVVAERLSSQMACEAGVEVVGFVDDDPKEPTGWLGPLANLALVCEQYDVAHVVVAFSRAPAEEIVDALRPLQGRVPISVVPRLFDVTPTTADAHDLVAGYPALSVVPSHSGHWQRVAKRVVDIVGGTIGLLLSVPVIVVATVGVRLSSSGPIFLRQQRVGRGGKQFTIWKFRTFTVTESIPPPEVLASGELVTGPFPKLKVDPRMTAFGRLLRRASIDELPQLLNVVTGTMSLVGPRPLPPDFAWNFSPWALKRYDVKPGLTGLWQVSGRNDLTYEEMCRLDTLYATSWSTWLDVRILARTARAVLSGRGCY